MTDSRARGPAPEGGGQAHRVIFIDLARAAAVVLMITGHTVSALIRPDYSTASWYDAWQFQRGLTSSLFLLLSGFAFSIATARHWTSHLTVSPQVWRRLRRFTFFTLLGYTLHLPVLPLVRLSTINDARWNTFLLVDVLQLIGVTFILVQVLVLVCRTRTIFMAASFVLGAALIGATPFMWRVDWVEILPLGLAAYLYPGTGSIFPVFPFAASVMIGAGAGQVYAHWGAAHLRAFANQVLLGGGLGLMVVALAARLAGVSPYGPGPGSSVPIDFLLRTGVSLVVLGLIAHASRYLAHLPRPLGAVAQESLLVYYGHLCVVYGSIWSIGLLQILGPTLRPLEALPIAAVLIALMTLFAWQWHWCKHARPGIARWVRMAVAGFVVYRLI